jgi:hypothetical protein
VWLTDNGRIKRSAASLHTAYAWLSARIVWRRYDVFFTQAGAQAYVRDLPDAAASRLFAQRYQLRHQASAAADEAEQLAINQNRAGFVSYTNVVVAQPAALAARSALAAITIGTANNGSLPDHGPRRRMGRSVGTCPLTLAVSDCLSTTAARTRTTA